MPKWKVLTSNCVCEAAKPYLVFSKSVHSQSQYVKDNDSKVECFAAVVSGPVRQCYPWSKRRLLQYLDDFIGWCASHMKNFGFLTVRPFSSPCRNLDFVLVIELSSKQGIQRL